MAADCTCMFKPIVSRTIRKMALAWLCYAGSVAGQSLDATTVTLRGQVRSTTQGRVDRLAMVEVAVPYDDAPRLGADYWAVADDLEAPSDASRAVMDAEASRDVPSPDVDASASAPAYERKSTPSEPQGDVSIDIALVRGAIDAAQRAQGMDEAGSRLDAMASRARASGALPDLRLRAGREVDQSLRLSPTQDDPYRYTQSGGVNLLFEATLTWRLGKLLFAVHEPSVERLRQSRWRERQRMVQAVLTTVFDWYEAKWRWEQGAPRANAARVAMIEAAVRLDIMTDGWFEGAAAARLKSRGGQEKDQARRLGLQLGPNALVAESAQAVRVGALETQCEPVRTGDEHVSELSRRPCFPKPRANSRSSSGASMR